NLAYEFNQRRSTLNLGAAISNDTIDAFVGIPDGLTTLTCTKEAKNDAAFRTDWLECPVGNARVFKSGNKVTTDFIVGFTQVWNRRTLLQANYARGNEDGYLTDPYKQISVVKSNFGETAVLYEKRPRSRNTNSLFFKFVNLPLDQLSLNVSYRFFWDDWDVQAHTLDGRLRYNITHKIYLQGHARLHRQGAASFYDKQISIDADSSSYYADKPRFITADTRLGRLMSATVGIKVGYKMNEKIGFSGRIEQMQQYYYGALPRLKVWIAQLILNVKF
ncbi:MAG TPA: DUF3570 domain-containing protein, partial [Gammaproteobacteria bacterium]|nr:DUF3570 domain-containing protein [Gammaproteobacteria bacterium]